MGALDIHWSDGILQETTRNLIGKFDFSREDAEVLVDRLSAYIPTALVEVKKRDETRALCSRDWLTTTRTSCERPTDSA
ncbi:MAG: hypothetical protein ACSLFD_12310 [Solirubrobacterales bacterium]